ncbi:MAG: lipid-A-disaccharide synthase, partial [Thermodesulfobacteriota bacterium]
MKKRIFIVSGEESGDKHGASLLRELTALVPDLEIRGMGGQRMRGAGLMGLDSKEVSVVGIVEVLEKSPKIMATLGALKRTLRNGSFDAAIFIDFPDFNLRLAKEARALGIPVIYYISPQVWAWRKGRVKKIARLVDKMLVVLPFEVEIYRRAGVDVEYVGHPLSEEVRCGLTKTKAREALGLPKRGKVVALLPGSRSAEVARHLPVMLGAAEQIQDRLGRNTHFIIPAAGSVDPAAFNKARQRAGINVSVVEGRMYEALRASDAAVVASGTATLETAVMGIPMVIIYKMSGISYGI